MVRGKIMKTNWYNNSLSDNGTNPEKLAKERRGK